MIDCTVLFHFHDPFRSPDHRYRRCHYLLEQGQWLSSVDDPQTMSAYHFFVALSRCCHASDYARLEGLFPALAEAYRFFREAAPLQRSELEARLLADEADDCIAAKLALSPAAVDAYRAVYFNIRPYLNTPEYITQQVLGPKIYTGLTEEDGDILLKLFAYRYGPAAVDAVLDYFKSPWVVPERIDQLDSPARQALLEKVLIKRLIVGLSLSLDREILRQLLRLSELVVALLDTTQRSAPFEELVLVQLRSWLDQQEKAAQDRQPPSTVSPSPEGTESSSAQTDLTESPAAPTAA